MLLEITPPSAELNQSTEETNKRRPARQVLMTSVDAFCVRYAINPWMDAQTPVDEDRARDQWCALREAIEDDADVRVLPAEPGLPDLCFCANAGLVWKNQFVPSHFKYRERQGETPVYTAFMSELGFEVRSLPKWLVFEGAGDALFDRHHRLWMGHGPRTQLASASHLAQLLHVEVMPLELVDPRFYHLDTCFTPLSSGHTVYYPGAFSEVGLNLIRRFVPARLRIEVSEVDACDFACNMINLDDRVIAHRMSDALRVALQQAKFDVRTVDLSEFLKSGGSAKCLTLAL